MIDPNFAIIAQQRWNRRGPDGRRIVAFVFGDVTEPSPRAEIGGGTPVTVHGLDGFSGGDDSSGRSSVSWIENERVVQLFAQGIGTDELVRIADRSLVAPNGRLVVATGANLDEVAQPTGPANTALGSWTTAAQVRNGAMAQRIDLTVEAPRAGETLDNTAYIETRRTTLGGIERSVTDKVADDPTTAQQAMWFDGGYRLTVRVARRLGSADLDRLVAGVHLAAVEQVRDVYDAISARGAALPALDRATTADGTVVSVHGDDTSEPFLCATTEGRTRCVSSAPAADGQAPNTDRLPLTRLTVAGRVVLLGWQRGTSDMATPLPGDASLTQVDGSAGRFAYVSYPAGHGGPQYPPPVSLLAWDAFWA